MPFANRDFNYRLEQLSSQYCTMGNLLLGLAYERQARPITIRGCSNDTQCYSGELNECILCRTNFIQVMQFYWHQNLTSRTIICEGRQQLLGISGSRIYCTNTCIRIRVTGVTRADKGQDSCRLVVEKQKPTDKIARSVPQSRSDGPDVVVDGRVVLSLQSVGSRGLCFSATVWKQTAII